MNTFNVKIVIATAAAAIVGLYALGKYTSKGIPGQAELGFGAQLQVGWSVLKNKAGAS